MKYKHNLPKAKLINRERLLLHLSYNKKVLHLGCADSPLLEERILGKNLLHNKISNVAKDLWGIDIDEMSIEKLQQLGINNLLHGDAEHLGLVAGLKEQKFDVIIAGELIEHLDNPGLFLESCKDLIEENGILVLTTPNAFRLINFFTVFFNIEIIHPDYNFWFSPTSLKTLLEKHGYFIREFYIDSNPLGVSIKKNLGLGEIMTRIIYALVNHVIAKLIIKIWPYFGNGLIFIAQRKHE